MFIQWNNQSVALFINTKNINKLAKIRQLCRAVTLFNGQSTYESQNFGKHSDRNNSDTDFTLNCVFLFYF